MKKKVKLSELLLNYERALTDYGLSYGSRLHQLQCAARVINLHENQGAEYLDDSLVAAYTNEIAKRYDNGVMGKNAYHNRLRELTRFVSFAKTNTIILPYPLKGSRSELLPGFARIADDFITTITHANTRNDARWVAHKYFVWLAEQGFADLFGTGSEQIQKFLLVCSKTMMQNSMHNVKLYLKKLYEHLYRSGQSESDYKTLLSFPVNRETKIFPTLPKADIAKLLDSIDRKTKMGKRNYAIMMLGAVLGLRACDVVSLKLTDIDWRNGEVKILQAKTAKTVVLPLTTDVGEALQDYILNARPQIDVKQIFLRINAPHTPLISAVTVGEIFEACCKKSGLPVNKRFHTLRRSLATSMITAGVSVYDVAQELGDSDIDSIKPYIALDSKHLKICALPFDGIVPLGGDWQ